MLKGKSFFNLWLHKQCLFVTIYCYFWSFCGYLLVVLNHIPTLYLYLGSVDAFTSLISGTHRTKGFRSPVRVSNCLIHACFPDCGRTCKPYIGWILLLFATKPPRHLHPLTGSWGIQTRDVSGTEVIPAAVDASCHTCLWGFASFLIMPNHAIHYCISEIPAESLNDSKNGRVTYNPDPGWSSQASTTSYLNNIQ